MLLTAGNVSDVDGARLLLERLPSARHLLTDKGYDVDWFRAELWQRNIILCIPERCSQKVIRGYDTVLALRFFGNTAALLRPNRGQPRHGGIRCFELVGRLDWPSIGRRPFVVPARRSDSYSPIRCHTRPRP
ncbi:MAG: hypothetical protein LBH53_03205 [Puniceicoccales bacterium]|nr:hypothetical protein [Puniceicoccales bacterium]